MENNEVNNDESLAKKTRQEYDDKQKYKDNCRETIMENTKKRKIKSL